MKWTRVIVYAALIGLALLFLVPLGVVVVNSLRSSREIAATSLIGWPGQMGHVSLAASSQSVKTKSILGAFGTANSSQLLLRRPVVERWASSSCLSAPG